MPKNPHHLVCKLFATQFPSLVTQRRKSDGLELDTTGFVSGDSIKIN